MKHEYELRLELAFSNPDNQVFFNAGVYWDCSVHHDDYCAIYSEGFCDCDPEITMVNEEKCISVSSDGKITEISNN